MKLLLEKSERQSENSGKQFGSNAMQATLANFKISCRSQVSTYEQEKPLLGLIKESIAEQSQNSLTSSSVSHNLESINSHQKISPRLLRKKDLSYLPTLVDGSGVVTPVNKPGLPHMIEVDQTQLNSRLPITKINTTKETTNSSNEKKALSYKQTSMQSKILST